MRRQSAAGSRPHAVLTANAAVSAQPRTGRLMPISAVRGKVRRENRRQRGNERRRQRQSEHAPADADHGAFGQQLTNDPCAAGADGGTKSDLAPPRRGARQLQAPDVGGDGDQQ